MSIISLTFTLYRFVCDKVTFSNIFAVDAQSRRFPENSPFYCCWAIIPRQRTLPTVRATEWSGCTTASYFKSHGNEIVLPFNNATGNIDIEGDANVITFNVRPYSNSNEPISVVAKGTLDPRPYVGKSSRNYAIKLRDVSGQTIGKLLFALEAREELGSGVGISLGMGSGCGAIAGPFSDVLSAAGGAAAGDSTIGNCNENCASRSGAREAGNVQYSKKEPYPRRDDSPYSNAVTPTTELLEGMPLNSFSCLRAPTSTSAVAECPPHSYVKLDLCIERIVAKEDRGVQENSMPLLLGASYYMKVRFGGGVSATQTIECQDASRITYKDRMTFVEDVCSNDKLRFSLWENEKQVAGFSLSPTKFRVDIGMKKEYAIPFRYYPTRQSAYLELTVQRTGHQSLEDIERTVNSLQTARGVPFGGMRFMDEQLYLKRHESEDTEHLNGKAAASTSGHTTASLSPQTPGVVEQKDRELEKLIQEDAGMQHIKVRTERRSPRTLTKKENQGESEPQPHKTQVGDGQEDPTDAGAGTVVPPPRSGETLINSSESSLTGKRVSPMRIGGSVKRHSALRRMTSEEASHSAVVRQYPGSDVQFSMKDVVRSRETTRSASPLRAPGGPKNDGGPRRLEDEYPRFARRSKFLHMEDASQPQRDSPRTSPDQQQHDDSTERERLADSLLQRMSGRPGMSTTLMEEWMEWRNTCLSARSSRSGSERSAFCREESLVATDRRGQAMSPRPTKSLSHVADLRPYTPVVTRHTTSDGRPPIPGR